MKTSQRLYLIRKNLSQNSGRTMLTCIGIGIGMAIFLAATSLGLGIQRNVVKRLREVMPERLISVQRMRKSMGAMQVPTKPITDADIAQLRKMPEVEKVYAQIPITFPIRAEGELLGIALTTDVVINGVEPSLVRQDVAPKKKFDYLADPAKPVPVMVSRYLVDMYNLGYAKANYLPELSDSWIIGRNFRVILGQSTVPILGNSPKSRAVECEVVGLTSNPSLLGVVMPAEYVRRFNLEFSRNKEPQYSALHILLRDNVDIDEFEKELAVLEYQPDAQRELLRRAQFFIKILLLVLLIFSSLVLFIAFSNVVSTFSLILLQRRFEIGLLRAVGATRAAVVGLFLGEAALIGALGGAFGVMAAWALATGINTLCRNYLPPLTILATDQTFMIFGWGLALAGVLFSAAASILATFPTVLQATSRQPAVLLRHE